MKKAWTNAAVLGVAVLVAYGMTLRAPLIFDDVAYIRDNALFRLPWPQLLSRVVSLRYFATTQELSYQPLVTLVHYLLASRLGLLRLSGLLLHAADAAL